MEGRVWRKGSREPCTVVPARSTTVPNIQAYFEARRCERKRSNPWAATGRMDCFVAFAPRNDGRAIHKPQPLTHHSTSSLRKQGPILRGACFEKGCSTTSLNRKVLWLWVPAFARTTQEAAHLRIPAARFARVMHDGFARKKTRAQGKPDAQRTRSLACKDDKAHERSHHRFAGFIRPSLRNGFNGLLRDLLGDRALLPPSPAGDFPPT